jgi:Xaa-Pro aminopeptidase
MVYESRRARLLDPMRGEGLDAMLVTHLPNIRYLTGFSGSTAMLVLEREGAPTLVTDSRYVTQAREEAAGCSLEPVRETYEQTLARWLSKNKIRRLAFEELHLNVAQLRFLEAATSGGTDLVASRERVERLRMVKDHEEIEQLRRAASGLRKVLEGWMKRIEPGALEQDLAAELDYGLRRFGYERNAFETIVASGPRSALPHGRPTARRLESGDAVVVDFGGMMGGYASDVTRTFAVGSPPEELRSLYEIVATAQQAAIETARPGVRAEEVDRTARQVIERSGLGDHFGHGTGHGLGLEVHEAPWIRRGSSVYLEPGMVFTVEPGIYLPERFGVRLEDDLLVTERGAELLSRPSESRLQEFSWVCYR